MKKSLQQTSQQVFLSQLIEETNSPSHVLDCLSKLQKSPFYTPSLMRKYLTGCIPGSLLSGNKALQIQLQKQLSSIRNGTQHPCPFQLASENLKRLVNLYEPQLPFKWTVHLSQSSFNKTIKVDTSIKNVAGKSAPMQFKITVDEKGSFRLFASHSLEDTVKKRTSMR